MIYAFRKDELTIFVAAADTMAELLAFNSAFGLDQDLGVTGEQINALQMKLQKQFDGYVYPPFIISADTSEQIDAYIELKSIKVHSHYKTIDLQIEMMKQARKGMTAKRAKTIAELTGLDKEDRWKDPELEEADEAAKKKAVDRAKEKGMGDDSFQRKGEQDKISVTAINVEVDADGKPTKVSVNAERFGKDFNEHVAMIDEAERQVRMFGRIQTSDFFCFATKMIGQALGVFFVKKKRYIDPNNLATICTTDELADRLPAGMVFHAEGIYQWPGMQETPVQARLRDKGFIFDPTVIEVFLVDPELLVPVGRPLHSSQGAVFFRFDIEQSTLSGLEPTWEHSDRTFMDGAQGFGEDGDNVWFAFHRESLAQTFRGRMLRKGLAVSEIYSVDATNHRLIAKGAAATASSLTSDLLLQPRPWNGLASDLLGMSAEQLKANHEAYQGREFIICCKGADETGRHAELRVHIAPASYFEDTGEMYPNRLEIDHILPEYLKEISAGLYSTKSTDYITLMFDLCNRRGFNDDFDFQLHVNSL